MAKLSLWLLTLQKDKPFTFLDHAIRSGDSLVGIAATHQLTSFSLDGTGPDMPMFTDAIQKRLDAVRLLRRQISELADNSAEDVEKKTLMLCNAEQQTQRLAYAANFLLAACWEATSATDRDERLKQSLVHVENNFKDLPVEQLEAEGKQRLQKAGCPKPFHWPLEFPEAIFEWAGFDAFVGNPPFLGGVRISELYGESYNAFLSALFPPASRKTDICAFFFRRAEQLLRPGGVSGLLATNTISQGTTRKGGLTPILESCHIINARPSFRWPGQAAVIAALVVFAKTSWSGLRLIDGNRFGYISDLLAGESGGDSSPALLASNAGRCFQGSSILGMGFFLTPQEAQEMICHNRIESEVIKPAMGGQELNETPDLTPPRWIIDMGERDEQSARRYPLAFSHLEQHVKPERLKKDPEQYPRLVETWWKYWHSRGELYGGIESFGLRQVIVRARVSDHHMLNFLPADYVFTEQLAVFLHESLDVFCVLQSSIHEVWTRKYASTLKTDVRYIPTDCHGTFAYPRSIANLGQAGRIYCEHRRATMVSRQDGLTKTYNRFHKMGETAEDIQKLRQLHVEMDNAVAAAYGWADLDLGHGFHETKQGLRFTISEPARREVLARLLKLNHERYAEEVAKGLHGKKKGKGKKGVKVSRARGLALFDTQEDE
jgi:hypothetical protein